MSLAMSDDTPDSSDQAKLSKLPKSTGDSLALNQSNLVEFNMEGLPEATKIELKKKQAEGLIKLQEKAIDSNIDTKSINQRLGDINDAVAKASQDQSSATVTGVYTDKLGRTEIIMGNTETAQKGKLTNSQRGLKDNTLLYVGIAVVAVLILAMILKN